METITLNFEMMVVLGLLAFTVFLFVSEIVRVDLAAIIIMVMLGGLSYYPPLSGLADVGHLFDGFASNAVMSIIAVMIIGAGLDKTGLMTKVAAAILKYGGSTEQRIIPIISGTVGIISSFMQNVGAAALFLPVVSRISARTEIPLSRLLMPMGFCAILGGTMTLVGSSPMILLNELILTANETLPESQQMETFGLFSVTPIGISLILTGILYFMLFGRWVLPGKSAHTDAATGSSMKDYLRRIYGLQADLFEVEVPEANILLGESIADVMDANHVYIIGSFMEGRRQIAPPVKTKITTPCRLAVLGHRKVVEELAEDYDLIVHSELDVFAEDFRPPIPV